MFEDILEKFNRWNKDRLPFSLNKTNLLAAGAVLGIALLGSVSGIALTGPAHAILFSGASTSSPPAPGTLSTTLALKTKAGGNISANQFFEFGLPIAPATMTTSQKVVCTDASSNVLTVQEDNRVIDADGYIRWVMITTLLATAPGASSTNIAITATTGSPDTSNPITKANLLAQTISADTFECQNEITLPNGDVYVAKATDGLNGATSWTYGSPFNEGVWRQGPLCTEFVVLMPYVKTGTPSDYLYVEQHIAAYKKTNAAWNNTTNPITGVRVFCFNENGFNGVMSGWSGTPKDYAYDWAIKMGASTLSTALSLTGTAGAGTLTLGATSGIITTTRSSGTWTVNNSTPNSSDVGKGIYQISTGKIGLISGLNSSTSIGMVIATDQAFTGTSISAADWKQMGVFHYWGSRVSNTTPAIGGSWWGTNHDTVYPILTTAYIQASQMVPNFRLTPSSAAAPSFTLCNEQGCHPASLNLRPGRNSTYDYTNDEASTGDSPNIGVLTEQQSVGVIYWDSATEHANARKSILLNAEVGHRKPFWFRNEEYGTTNSISDAGCYQTISTNDGSCPQINAYRGVSNQFFSFAGNHSGQTDYFPYLMTGFLYQLQNLQQITSMYPMQGSGYAIYDNNAMKFNITLPSTIVGNNGTGSFPCQTGEGVTMRMNGYRPQVGGVNVSITNHFYYRSTTANTGELYDTWAHAMTGGATGRIVFSSAGSTNANNFTNGFVKNCVNFNGDQCRTYAWGVRSLGQPVALAPDSPLSTNLIAAGNTKTQLRRNFDNFFVKMNSQFVGNTAPSGTSEFLSGNKPRFRNVQTGVNGGQWQLNYNRMALLNLVEAGVQSPTSSNLQADLDWTLADAIQWHVEPTIPPAFYCSSYYVQVSTNNNTGNSPTYNDYSGIFTACAGTPYATSQGGVAFGGMDPTNRTASISSVAVPTAVVVTLSGNWFDTSFKTDYEGRAWIGIKSGSTIVGYGRIVTVNSPTQVTVDFTANSAYGYTITPLVPPTGSGQGVRLPYPPVSVFLTNVAATDISYTGTGAGNVTDSAFAIMDRCSLEIAKQRSINSANYTAAVTEMTGRNFPTTWSSATGPSVKFNYLSRI